MKKIIISEGQLKTIINETKGEELYFSTFSGAVGTARDGAEKRGYEIDDDSWWREISTGHGRPKDGETHRFTISLLKNGKPQKKCLHIQVYNRGSEIGNNFELNYYIN